MKRQIRYFEVTMLNFYISFHWQFFPVQIRNIRRSSDGHCSELADYLLFICFNYILSISILFFLLRIINGSTKFSTQNGNDFKNFTISSWIGKLTIFWHIYLPHMAKFNILLGPVKKTPKN